jgi:hypothetical protein
LARSILFPALNNAVRIVPINQSGVWIDVDKLGAGLKGITIHPTKLRIIMAKGAIKKITVLDLLGITISLHKSFKPSARGCKRPKIPTMLGPRRRWTAPMILRSANVK